MCSLSYYRLENLRVDLLSCLSLDEASKGAITMNVSLFFPVESTTGSVLLCSFLSLLSSLRPPVGRGRWPLTLSLVLLEVSSCLKGVFLSTVPTCMFSMRDCCKVNASNCLLSLLAYPGVNAASH
ncbi:hypothetical protein AMECASPLE_039680 [Ameca splendens]|uniref:Uncharacterized protein n=1 Tax=Ameca splendens TaxID=208324 RepID=A0ABV0ZIL5_9TELE